MYDSYKQIIKEVDDLVPISHNEMMLSVIG